MPKELKDLLAELKNLALAMPSYLLNRMRRLIRRPIVLLKLKSITREFPDMTVTEYRHIVFEPNRLRFTIYGGLERYQQKSHGVATLPETSCS